MAGDGHSDKAETCYREVLDHLRRAGESPYYRDNTLSNLGAIYRGQKKYAEAEPLLVKGYAGMKTRANLMPAQGKIRLALAVDRLIALAAATNRPEEANRWRAERANYPEVAPLPKEDP